MRRAASGGPAWFVFVGLMVVGLNLRGPITSPAPVIGEIRSDLGLGTAAAGMLTTIPVLCFGVLALPASRLIRRVGIDRAVLVSMVGTALGIVVRSAGGVPCLMIGSAVLGAALTVGNVVALLVIRRDFLTRVASTTAAYTASLNVGSMLTSALTAPLSSVAGWQLALGAGAVLAILGAVLWWRVTAGGDVKEPAPEAPSSVSTPTGSLWRYPLVWVLTITMVIHLFIYYALTAWLPEFLGDALGMAPTSAGFASSLMQVLALIGAFAAPAFVRRIGAGGALAGLAMCWALTPAGLLIAPSWWLVWSFIGALAQGGLFTALFMLIVERARSPRESGAMSAVVQGFGYALASVGPVFMGHVHDATGGWATGMLSLSGMALVVVAIGLGFALRERDGQAS